MRALIALAIACACTPSSPPEQKSAPIVASAAGERDEGARESRAAGDAGVIPNTDVPDTPENRAVIDFCERYRVALEHRDVETLVSMASPSYRDPDSSYDELVEYLRSRFKKVDQVRYEIRYRRISHDGGHVIVDIHYAASYRIEEAIRRSVDENQLVLEPHAGSFRILSGM